MTARKRREQIEHWVGDFLDSAAARSHEGVLLEYAPEVLHEFLASASATRDVDPGEIEASDLKPALLEGVGSLALPTSVRRGVPALCGDLLAELERQGRLADGRSLGLAVRALGPAYLEATSGTLRPIVNPGAPIGRNDPCPCGSGRKYKKCCMDALGS